MHIGGGEPLLRPEELGAVLQIAAQASVAVEYVETNSSWFKDPDSAIAMLAQLGKQGLQTLLVSISPFHNEYIPYFTKAFAVFLKWQKRNLIIHRQKTATSTSAICAPRSEHSSSKIILAEPPN